MKKAAPMIPNPLLEAFRNEGHGWSGGLVELLEDFEVRLQMLESDPGTSAGRVTPVFKRPAAKRSARSSR